MDRGCRHRLQILTMAHCETISLTTTKACSGKCKSSACGAAPRVWVIAACEGMVSLLSKDGHGALAPITYAGSTVFASMQAFQQSIHAADHAQAFDQLLIIGSSSDIAWVHASLPHSATQRIAAEINHSLLAEWFKQPPPLTNLWHALSQLLT